MWFTSVAKQPCRAGLVRCSSRSQKNKRLNKRTAEHLVGFSHSSRSTSTVPGLFSPSLFIASVFPPVCSAVSAQLRVAAVLEQLRVVAPVAEQLHAVAAVSVRPRVVAAVA